MKRHGIFQKDDYDFAAKSSKEFADRLISRPWSALIRFCSVSFKTDVQMRERFRRTSNNIKKDWEKVSEAGTLIKGFVETKPKIGKKVEGGWETSEEEARRLGGKVIEFLPTYDGRIVEMEKV